MKKQFMVIMSIFILTHNVFSSELTNTGSCEVKMSVKENWYSLIKKHYYLSDEAKDIFDCICATAVLVSKNYENYTNVEGIFVNFIRNGDVVVPQLFSSRERLYKSSNASNKEGFCKGEPPKYLRVM